MKQLAEEHGAQLLLVMDGVRRDITTGSTSHFARSLNVMAREVAAAREIPFLDLQGHFEADWRERQQRFDFVSDGHWNEHAHGLVAKAIAESLGASALSGQTPVAGLAAKMP
jgi:hypothetical protein